MISSYADTQTPSETVTGPRLRVPALFYKPPPGSQLPPPPLPGVAQPSAEGEDSRAFSMSTRSHRLMLDQLYGPKVEVLSRYQSALKGAGLGMKLGWIAGCLANQTHIWDDRTSWYVAGAAAAAGALMGGTSWADNPSWNIRVEWDEEEGR